MKTRAFLSLGVLFLPVAVSLAGEPVQIDKDFSFRLDQPNSEASPSTPFPSIRPHSKNGPSAPVKTPEGRPLPLGTQPFKFNGCTYYRIPLAD